MFTGIIEGLGTVSTVDRSGRGCRLAITADFDLAGTRIGDSIAVNGACLTAIVLQGRRFSVDVSPETLGRSNLGKIQTGERVNLERALRLSDRLDGHLVSGHVDGIGRVERKIRRDNTVFVTVKVPEPLARYMIEKGSVAVDGVSLTINRCDRSSFDVALIPHTADVTTISMKRVGDAVNIEVDMIGKYVERFLLWPGSDRAQTKKTAGGIDAAFLAKSGFI